MLEPEDLDARGGATCCECYRENVQFLGVVWDGESEAKRGGRAEGKGREQL